MRWIAIRTRFKAAAYRVIKRFPLLRSGIRLALEWLLTLRFCLRTIAVRAEETTLLFCAYDGRSYACSPKAIYEYCLSDPRFQGCHFIWAFKNPERYEFLKHNPNTTLVRCDSGAYDRALAASGCWIVNFRLKDSIRPRKGQVYLQCWHGTPLKRLGFDIRVDVHNAMNSLREIRRRYQNEAKRMHYLLSPSPFATECFQNAWNLQRLGKQDVVLELGYPRNDFLYNYRQSDVQKIREKLGLAEETRKILLYAPTWRDNSHTSALGYTHMEALDFATLREALEQEYFILLRTHYLIANKLPLEEFKDFLMDVSAVDDINELYIIADMLITDYSSVFFDFASLQKPIVFYMHDLEEYRDRLRGFYLELSDLPGPVVTQQAKLVHTVRALGEGFRPDAHYLECLRRFSPLDDGQAAKRIAQTVLLPRIDNTTTVG